MSGFSAELIDYLEGRITFEEFDRRRDERKAKVSHRKTTISNKQCHIALAFRLLECGETKLAGDVSLANAASPASLIDWIQVFMYENVTFALCF